MKQVSIRRFAVLVLVVAAAGCARRSKRTAPPPARADTVAVAAPVVGVILAQSGEPVLQRYAALVQEGVRLAVDEYRARGGRVELAVVDDGGDPARDPALVRTLEQRGAVAVIGPLLREGLARASGARGDSMLVLISPTASEDPAASLTFTLNAVDAGGAAAIADYARSAGLRRLAVLHPNTAEAGRLARSFIERARAGGATVAADITFDSTTTTFASQVRQLVQAKPDAVYIPASERDVRQLAPQLQYYGLPDRVQVLGNDAWTSDEVLRVVEPRVLNGVIATTPLLKNSQQTGWGDFVKLYESTYRRTLNSPYPALGYDAARLLLSSLPDGRVRARDVARRLETQRSVRGATGILTIENGSVRRTPFLVRIENRTLIPLSTGAAPR